MGHTEGLAEGKACRRAPQGYKRTYTHKIAIHIIDTPRAEYLCTHTTIDYMIQHTYSESVNFAW